MLITNADAFRNGEISMLIPAAEWASIMAHVSARSDNAQQHEAAEHLHGCAETNCIYRESVDVRHFADDPDEKAPA